MDPQRVAVTEPQRGADAGTEGEVGPAVAQGVELGGAEVGDPDRAGAGALGQSRADDVVEESVDLGDVGALADALGRLAESPELRRSQGEAGRRRYEERFTHRQALALATRELIRVVD